MWCLKMNVFRKLKPGEAHKILDIIKERMEWMDQQHLHHWNEYDYINLYPLSYYEEMCRLGQVYALEDSDTDTVISAAVILVHDERWPDDEPALYIHNFASSVHYKGAGREFIGRVEDLARKKDKKYVRLDVLRDYEPLAEYYASMGYQEAGTCSDGNYRGILRQKGT